MKTLLLLALALPMAPTLILGQDVVLSWGPSPTAVPVGQVMRYNAYQAPVACADVTPATVFQKITPQPIPALTLTLPKMPVGVYCFRATAFLTNLEGVPSPTAGVSVGPLPPVSFTVNVTVAVTIDRNGQVVASVTQPVVTQGQE